MFNYNLVLDKEIHWYLLLLEYLLIMHHEYVTDSYYLNSRINW